MATWTNGTRNSATFTNQDFGIGDLTWDEATFTWDDAGASTWDTQRDAYTNQTKNSSTMTNQTKN